MHKTATLILLYNLFSFLNLGEFEDLLSVMICTRISTPVICMVRFGWINRRSLDIDPSQVLVERTLGMASIPFILEGKWM